MKQYLELTKKIISHGTKKPPARENMPHTISISGNMMKHNLQDGFPLLTTKKVDIKGIFYELLWFLNGNTNIKYLVDKNVNIWNDAYRWYLKYANSLEEVDYDYLVDDPIQNKTRVMSKSEFIENIKNNKLGTHKNYKLGDMGKIYGYQWRNRDGIDQLKYIIDSIKNNQFSRYHIIDGWNPKDKEEMGLPPCHLLYQFIGRGKHLDLVMYQRSADFPLGVPYNFASMGLLLTLISKLVDLEPGEITWVGGDIHIYENQIDAMLTQIKRKPKELPVLKIKQKINTLEDILNLQFEDIDLLGYNPHSRIKIPLSTG